MLRLSLDVTPIGKPRMTRQDRWTDKYKRKGRSAVLRYFDYQDDVRRLLPPGFELPAELALTFFIPMPASWSKKKRAAMVGAPHDSTPDIDNVCKSFMDCFAEDKHVYSLVAEKYWAEAGSIEVEIAEPTKEVMI